MDTKEILEQNSNSWNKIADEWFGKTALPTYGPYTPTEEELNLFGDVTGKSVLDIGCGSGHSLCYMGSRGASELWGLDISSVQIENAKKLIKAEGFTPNLFVSPMEVNPGIPEKHFDIVYSIYALGWTTEIERTMNLVSSYLKPGGIFVFSWDNPLMQCTDAVSGEIIISRSYQKEILVNMIKGGEPMTLRNWKLSSYINAITNAGMKIVKLVEETDSDTMKSDCDFSEKYYSPFKATMIPVSFVMKAVKL